MGGEGGQTRARVAQARRPPGRAPWRPAAAEEASRSSAGGSSSRSPAEAMPGRDEVVQRFADLYAKHPGDFPSEAKEKAYLERLRACYPIHPELFDQLFGDWSTLEKFQQTRGVLRLMAAVIHALWERSDADLLILPARCRSTTPRSSRSSPSTSRTVAAGHRARRRRRALAAPRARPRERRRPSGGYSAARRVARTIYMGSAPTANAANRGIDDRRIQLGSVHPGEPPATFGDALARSRTGSTYLYDNAGRYWFSTQPSVNRLAADRAAQQRDTTVSRRSSGGCKLAQADRGPFARVHPAPRVGVGRARRGRGRPRHPRPRVPTPARPTSRAPGRGRGDPRPAGRGRPPNRNMLVFLAADTLRLAELDAGRPEVPRLESCRRRQADLTLDAFQLNQAKTPAQGSRRDGPCAHPRGLPVAPRPEQPDPLAKVELRPVTVSGSDPWPSGPVRSSATRSTSSRSTAA